MKMEQSTKLHGNNVQSGTFDLPKARIPAHKSRVSRKAPKPEEEILFCAREHFVSIRRRAVACAISPPPPSSARLYHNIVFA